MGELFNRVSAEPIRGKDITIGIEFGGEFYVSESDEIIHYSGVFMKNDDGRAIESLSACPFYMRGKHSSDKSITDKIDGFIRIFDGLIVLED